MLDMELNLNIFQLFFLSIYNYGNVTLTMHYLLDNLLIKFGSKVYRKIVGIPIGTDCAPLCSDLLMFCYGRDFVLIINGAIEAFNSTL